MKHLTRREEWEQILGIWNLSVFEDPKTGKLGIDGYVLTGGIPPYHLRGKRVPRPGFSAVRHQTNTRTKGYWVEFKFCDIPINDINGACLDEDQFQALIEDMEIIQLLE